jgi:hypothetical protein
MSNRHERRKATAGRRKKLAKLKTATLDQHFDDRLRRVRTEFERTGGIDPEFECVTDGEIFQVLGNWPDCHAKAAAYAGLRDSFRRREVNRYVFVSEVLLGKAPGMLPADDPDHGEGVQVLAVERNGLRRYAVAEIMRNGETATLGPWVLKSDVPSGWLLELLEEGHSDQAPVVEPRPLERISASDFQHLAGRNPAQAAEFRDSVEIHDQLGDLMAGQVQKDADRDPQAIFMALESVLRMIVKDMGSPKGIGEFARFLRDHPHKFPMFSTVPDGVPSMQQVHRCNATLYRFVSEKRQAGHTPSAIFGAFVNMYMFIGTQAIGAVNLADRIENWAPEHLAKLREVGLRSSFELDDEEGHVFIALAADRYPIGVMGRRNTSGDLFVSRIVVTPHTDFTSAVDEIKKRGVELILGLEAKELLSKMEQVKGIAPR